MEIITPRKIPGPYMKEYDKKREKVFRAFSDYLKEKGLVRKFQRAEISVDFKVDPVSKTVKIDPERFSIYRVEKGSKEGVEKELLRILVEIKQEVDI